MERLDLPRIGTIVIGGVGGVTQAMPSYPVQIAIHELPEQALGVVSRADEAWVLLGRDLLNAHRLLLDGPRLLLELDSG